MATKRITERIFGSILRAPRAPSPFLSAPLIRPYPRLPRTLQPGQLVRRYAHQIPKPGRPSPPAGKDGNNSETKTRKQLEPHYELTFTCVPCGSRSSHTISKQGYHKGSVLITCPSCRNRHIISDHLNIFGDRNITVEDLMRERGQLVKRGTLGVDGDIEFWEDGTQTQRGAGNGGNNKAEGAVSSEASMEADEASKAREARDPSTSAATSSATTTTKPSLSGSGTRPRLDGGHSAADTPSTKRQFHKSRESRVWESRPSSFGEHELAELRASLRDEIEAPKTPTRSRKQNGEKTEGFTMTKYFAQSRNPEARVRLGSVGRKFPVQQRKPDSTPASVPEAGSPTETGPRTRTIYAWPEGSREAVEVLVDIDTGKVLSQMPDRVRRIQRQPGATLHFRKVTYAPPDSTQGSVAELAKATEVSSPQRPLPEETYERIARGVESAKELPPQKVSLEEFNLFEAETEKAI
ncbi:hypothetical protein PFICI_01230 [Pestalotiopsis fici W106-1]|uniref:DNL-type domain-containing protein n=1 Tax=Pestalotiopsis fici (strain W106-1 / CGMCC3.15140) TaxID=1229662 RepID=W3XPF9_PESFW|nr:uncharacterized protein PFICI_01230 [Pestalotiopsis fici W106-1]ETS87402.1 hypothetical protein PFICI_01230 [Pestalotiopsis fici W106-1]